LSTRGSLVSRRVVPALAAAALVAPLVMLPLLVRPQLGIGAASVGVAVGLAWISPAYPLGLSGTGDLVPLAGSVDLPDRAVVSVLFAWMAAGILFAVIRRPDRAALPMVIAVPVLLSLALFAVMLLRLTGSPAEALGSAKVQLFLTVNLAVLVAGVLVGRHRRDLELCLGLMLTVAVIGAGALLVQLINGAEPVYPGRYGLSGDDPIAIGRLSATGLLIATYALLTAGAAVRSLALCTVPVLAVAFLASGSRGPFVGLLLGLIVLGGLMARQRGSGGHWPLVFGGIVLGVLAASHTVPGDATNRATGILFGGESGLDTTGRAELWAEAWRSFLDHPELGVGTGGFAAVDPLNIFPHNLLLEAAAEWGLLGLVPLLGALGVGIAKMAGGVRRPPHGEGGLAALVTALFAAALVNAMVSGDITTNSDVWLTLGLGLGLASRAPPRTAPVERSVGSAAF
jgi:O-antigen ligase